MLASVCLAIQDRLVTLLKNELLNIQTMTAILKSYCPCCQQYTNSKVRHCQGLLPQPNIVMYHLFGTAQRRLDVTSAHDLALVLREMSYLNRLAGTTSVCNCIQSHYAIATEIKP